MYIIVGLGNSGEEYARTRHNTGRMAADFIAGKIEGIRVVTPDTFMNNSGSAVAKAMVGKSAKKLIVIYDDLDLPLGAIKISYNRGSGGHKGVESIIKALKTKEFIRIRIGIDRNVEVEKYILSEFKKSEYEVLKKVFKRVQEAIETIVESGLTRAMTKFNS
ncbi:MAG: peptidyl-tRNA hydrolase [Candidatus Zambryskibacteria bacterium]|nr:peptidyl-tRNA hydrolase [Candidatus Zambryskibacteria bacterium]